MSKYRCILCNEELKKDGMRYFCDTKGCEMLMVEFYSEEALALDKILGGK